MPLEIKHRFRHDCELPLKYQEDEDYSPYATRSQKTLRWLRSSTLVCKHLDNSQYFRSHASYLKEKRRHMTTKRYRHVIHPFSNFARRKHISMCMVWFVLFFIESYIGGFLIEEFLDRRQMPEFELILLVINIFLLVDILSRFFIGYPIEQTREIVLDPKDIVKQYLATYFFFDFIAAFSYISVYYVDYVGIKVRIFLYLFHKCRLVRVKSVLNSVDVMMRICRMSKSKRTVVIIVLIGILLLNEMTCLMGFISKMYELYEIDAKSSWFYQYKRSKQIQLKTKSEIDLGVISLSIRKYMLFCSLVMCHFFGSGTYHYKSGDNIEMLSLSIILMMGLIYYIFCVAKILQLFGVVNVSEIKYEEMYLQVSNYVRRNNFPRDLRKRINVYFEYKFPRKFFSENEILNSLSEHLRMEVLLYSCQNLIGEVRIFRGLSKAAVGCVLALLKQEIYIPDDLIMSADGDDENMYFILYGTCGVKLISGQEIMHVEDGDHIGEISKNFDAPRPSMIYSVVALEITEIYVLEKKDIKYCCRMYPEIVYKIEGMARVKTRQYNKMFALRQRYTESIGDIVDDLRKGKILEEGFTRQQLL